MSLLAFVPACGFQSNANPGLDPDAAPVDANAPIDARPDDVDASPSTATCFGTTPRVCFESAALVPIQRLTLASDIDTAATTACDQHNDQPAYCIVAGSAITLPAGTTVRAFGARALVLISTGAFELSGLLDVSSTSAAGALHPTGPGVPNRSCNVGAFTATVNSGGFGGSFGGKGGDGQRQDTGAADNPIAAPAVSFPVALRAGCAGGNGSTTTTGASVGQGGAGGGAVSIIASRLLLNGRINASGAAGTGGPLAKSGGGGGGSGGMIILDTPALVTGPAFALFANGGGGGQGGAFDEGQPKPGAGQSGTESTAPTVAGLGGHNLETAGGAGGNGAAGANINGVSASQENLPGNAGGGAGGGGAGFIRAPGITTNIAPPSTNP